MLWIGRWCLLDCQLEQGPCFLSLSLFFFSFHFELFLFFLKKIKEATNHCLLLAIYIRILSPVKIELLRTTTSLLVHVCILLLPQHYAIY